MFLNVSALWHEMTKSIVLSTADGDESKPFLGFEPERLEVVSMFCDVDLMLRDYPAMIVQIQGDEYFVTDKLPDIP